MPPKILHAMITSETGGTVFIADALQLDTGIWLVPEWREHPTDGWKVPARIIRVDVLEHQMPGPFGADLLVTYPIPKAVLDGHARVVAGVEYVVEEAPSIRVPIAKPN